MLTKLKQFLFGGTTDEEDDTPRFPARFQSIRWNKAARTTGVGTMRNKFIAIVEQGSIKQKLPFRPEIVDAYRTEMNMPDLDETGGQMHPGHDKLGQYIPNFVAYDQDRIR